MAVLITSQSSISEIQSMLNSLEGKKIYYELSKQIDSYQMFIESYVDIIKQIENNKIFYPYIITNSNFNQYHKKIDYDFSKLLSAFLSSSASHFDRNRDYKNDHSKENEIKDKYGVKKIHNIFTEKESSKVIKALRNHQLHSALIPLSTDFKVTRGKENEFIIRVSNNERLSRHIKKDLNKECREYFNRYKSNLNFILKEYMDSAIEYYDGCLIAYMSFYKSELDKYEQVMHELNKINSSFSYMPLKLPNMEKIKSKDTEHFINISDSEKITLNVKDNSIIFISNNT